MSSPALNPLVEKVRAAHPGAYDDMDDASLTAAIVAKYPQYSDLALPRPPTPHGQLPNGGDTGEGPIAQALTTFETKLSEMPHAFGQQVRKTLLPTKEEMQATDEATQKLG